MVSTGYAFTTPELANEYAEAKYDYYHFGAIEQGWASIEEITVHNEMPDLKEEKRQKALSKLTKEDRKLLGLE